jgi:cardiolipin synthase
LNVGDPHSMADPISQATASLAEQGDATPIGHKRELARALFTGGNRASLLHGGDMLFPAMVRAIDAARHEVWLATYIYHNLGQIEDITRALVAAARRGVQVKVVLDGFGSRSNLPGLRQVLCEAGVMLTVFRPIDRWWNWFQPGQFRRLHQKLCVVDGDVAFVGGVNLIDDRFDQVHGWSDEPRLDFAVQLSGPVVVPIEQAVRALWTRADLGRNFSQDMATLARSAEPVARARRVLKRMRMPTGGGTTHPENLPPVRAAFVMRDNFRRRRAIERSFIDAIRNARQRVDLISPYFYPGRAFRRVLLQAAKRGVQVRLLLQGKVDYRIAALAAHALYAELLSAGVRIFEYMPAFLHAKIGLADDDWATVGSSNIDPLSLLLNLEANAVIRDIDFVRSLAKQFDEAVAVSAEINAEQIHSRTLGAVLRRRFVAWCAHIYLRIAGSTGKY